mmetsp:Transcript_13301/g.28190  ORF Transcript_13301/g.28190 Transcript_13301/m.28190 type:complete len:118 (-) Transcript_13301:16-369(-)
MRRMTKTSIVVQKIVTHQLQVRLRVDRVATSQGPLRKKINHSQTIAFAKIIQLLQNKMCTIFVILLEALNPFVFSGWHPMIGDDNFSELLLVHYSPSTKRYVDMITMPVIAQLKQND